MENQRKDAKDTVAVCLNGCTLSFLLFKLKNSTGDTEGFLIGEVTKRSVSTITDLEAAAVREEKKFHVLSFVVLNKRMRFYDGFGRPDIAAIKSELGDKYKRLIGWFSYRCNARHSLSLRERAIHRHLLTTLATPDNSDFLLGLVTDSLQEQSHIHCTDYSFHTWNGSFKEVAIEMATLKASSPSRYQTSASHPELTASSPQMAVLEQQRSQFVGPSGEVLQSAAVERLYNTMLAQLQPLVSQLIELNNKVLEKNKEAMRLQELAEAESQEKEQIKDQPRSEQSDNLIDLSSPKNDNEQVLSGPSVDMDVGSNDLLSDSLAQTSAQLPDELLQPSIVASDTHTEPSSDPIQQSQELF